jgi:hypothetical protein
VARLGGGCLQGAIPYINDDLTGIVQTGYDVKTHEKTQPFNSELTALAGIMQLLAILLGRSRTDWCAVIGNPLAHSTGSSVRQAQDDPEQSRMGQGPERVEGRAIIGRKRPFYCMIP